MSQQDEKLKKSINQETKVCVECGFDRPLKLFYFNGPDLPYRKRKSKYCYLCRKRLGLVKSKTKVWTAFSAICKNAAQSVALSKEGAWTGAINPKVIEALIIAQGGRCAITMIPFCLPSIDTKLNSGITLTEWAKNLSIQNRGRVPVLVRISDTADWEPGNIILIISALKSFYDYCGSLYKTLAVLKSINSRTIAVPSVEDIQKAQYYLEQQQLIEINREIENEFQ